MIDFFRKDFVLAASYLLPKINIYNFVVQIVRCICTRTRCALGQILIWPVLFTRCINPSIVPLHACKKCMLEMLNAVGEQGAPIYHKHDSYSMLTLPAKNQSFFGKVRNLPQLYNRCVTRWSDGLKHAKLHLSPAIQGTLLILKSI